MATLLMFVPLLAVPIVATFGVPWLSAKVRTEGLAVPELPRSSSKATGVGQSRTARHSAEDLFAPVLEPPAVDLRMATVEMSQHHPAATGRNSHLKNASMVVTQEEAWNDPFARLTERKPAPDTDAKQTDAFNPPNDSDNWAIGDSPPMTPGESLPPEAPLPQEFPDPTKEETTDTDENPFAALDSNSPPEEILESQTPEPQVEVGANAFNDPVPTPRVNRDPNQFDPTRELFLKNDGPSSAPMRTAEVASLSPPPAAVESNTPNILKGVAPKREPLTWDSARARLKEFGISHFYLQPDAKGQVFHFRCAYSPGGNSRINRLFEAEAPNPLEAVGKVLDQLEASYPRASGNGN
ncbi:MAG: hypothetical protein KDA84_16980 [Planctomycetaceae bacterium]|nr:hypothetical protein [Planctomycetaceae bacterium]